MEPPSTVAVHILNTTARRVPVSRLRAVLAHVLGNSEPKTENGRKRSVELLLSEEIQDLNRVARGLDEPTDVLTFPAPIFEGSPWGEIAISIAYAERQALERGISLSDELCYLALHGALHLRGFDDIEEADREVMFAEMHRIGLELGLPEQREWTSLLEGREDSRNGHHAEVAADRGEEIINHKSSIINCQIAPSCPGVAP